MNKSQSHNARIVKTHAGWIYRCSCGEDGRPWEDKRMAESGRSWHYSEVMPFGGTRASSDGWTGD